MKLTTQVEHSPSSLTPEWPVLRRVKALRRVLFAFAMGLFTCLSYMGGIAFLRGLAFRTLKVLHRFSLICWCDALRDTTAARLRKGLKLSNFANKMIRSVYCDSPFVVIMKSVMNLSDASLKEHGVSFHAAQMVDIQRYVFLNTSEDTDREETEGRTLGISYLSDVYLLSFRTEKRPFWIRAASENVRNPMKHNPFYARSFNKSESGLERELHGFCRKRDKISSLSFSALLRTSPFANEITTAMTVQMLVNTVCFHEHEPRSKTKTWRRRNKRWQQHLVPSVHKVLTLNAPSFILGPVIGQNFILNTRVMQKHSSPCPALSNDSKPTTKSID